METLISFLIGFCFYMLPTIIAMRIGNKNTLAIMILNISTGWTGIGWIASLIWAVKK
ncbi:MAG: superinfection immunity protein [Candidatus Gracilibacteria bacterium]|nr:superinfection immunity protein [Candidatus Gracilibacteria bacterium]